MDNQEKRAAANIAKLKAAGVELVTVAIAGSKTLGIAKVGESGYYVTDWPVKDYEQAKELADERNARGGITPAQAKAVELGSMFGWHTPAADVDTHAKEAR